MLLTLDADFANIQRFTITNTPGVVSSIERNFKRKGSDQWETQKISINAQYLLAAARGISKKGTTLSRRNSSASNRGRA